MISLLSRRREPRKIGKLELDATIRESHNFKNDVTDYPVEDGFDISDHVVQAPERIVIEGFISNTPPKILGGLLTRTDGSNRTELAYRELLRMAGRTVSNTGTGATIQKSKPEIIDVFSILNTYTNMIIIDLRFPIEKDGGNAQYFICELKRLEKVKSDITVIQNVSELSGKAPGALTQAIDQANIGKQQGATVQSSILNNLFEQVEDKFGKKVVQ